MVIERAGDSPHLGLGFRRNGYAVKSSRSLGNRLAGIARRHWIPATSTAVVVGLLATAAVVWTASAPTAPVVDCSVLEAQDAATANALAVACSADVEVAGERTPWASTFAGADGTFRLDVSTVPRSLRPDGEWGPIDTTLQRGEEGIEVAAPVFPIFLNPGGPAGAGKPLGTIERDGDVFKVWFPLDLPVPSMEGSRLFYEFGDGIRLIVSINADATGFTPVLEVATPTAALALENLLAAAREAKGLPGEGLQLAYPITVSDGLDLAVDEESQMQAVDASGDVKFFAPPPAMWDSAGETVIYGSEVTEVASTDRAVQPSGGDHVSFMTATLTESTMVITPDEAMVASPDTVWPVYIDPDFSGYGAAQRIAIRTGGYNTTLNNWTNISPTMLGQGTGYCSDIASCYTQFTQRLVWRFDGLTTVAGLAGTDIVSASFSVNGVHSYNCTPQTTYLWRTEPISSASNWSLVWSQQLGHNTDSQRSSCSPPTNGYRSYDAKAGFQWAADSNSSSISLGLRAASETTMAGWKRFAADATISVVYNRAPLPPTGQKLTSPLVETCTTGIGRPDIASSTPTLAAQVSDPDGGLLAPSVELYRVTDLKTSIWSSGNQTPIASGSRAEVSVPSGVLLSGISYAWRMRVFDGARFGSWSSWCQFRVDTVAPVMPTVTPITVDVDTAYLENTERSGVGLTGAFSVNRGSSSDVVEFEYGFNSLVWPESAIPDANGSATITYTPSVAGTVTLRVRSVDAAGNFSPVRSYTFTVATPTEDGVWTLDEGSGTLAADSMGAPPRPLTVIGATWGDGPHALFETRDGDHALEFDGVNDYARTGAPVVDTTGSFAVSAHVMIDPARVGGPTSMTVLSQNGLSSSGFRLEYRAVCAGNASGCWAFVMPDASAGSAEAVVQSAQPVIGGEWTHLVGAYDAADKELELWTCDVGTPGDPAVGEPVKVSAPRTALPWPATGGLSLGRSLVSDAYTSYWDGSIDNVRVFDGQVMSEAKIRRLCQGAEAIDFLQGETALDPTTLIGG
jgi:Concanavalin A-like lectin/glucanases superfamily